MTGNQANKSFGKVEEMVKSLLTQIPFNLIEKLFNEANHLKEGMEEQIEKFENKGSLTEDQESTLDRFQSSFQGVSNIAETAEGLHDTVEAFRQILKQIEDVNTTI
jgi:CII-binding regulator of phage lambda lysogenization HflD